MYMFDEFQTVNEPHTRRPMTNSRYDVFYNIRDDQVEHVATMEMSQDENSLTKSPNAIAAGTALMAASTALNIFLSDALLEMGGEDGALDAVISGLSEIAGALCEVVHMEKLLVALVSIL